MAVKGREVGGRGSTSIVRAQYYIVRIQIGQS